MPETIRLQPTEFQFQANKVCLEILRAPAFYSGRQVETETPSAEARWYLGHRATLLGRT